MAISGSNRRPHLATGSSVAGRTPEQDLAFDVIKRAVDDLKILCGYGLVTVKGECRPWPQCWITTNHGYRVRAYIVIDNMSGPLDHVTTKDFFLDPQQGQVWCDYVGFRVPAAEMFWLIVKQLGARR